MNIKADIPQIALLRQRVERSIEFPLSTHGDFLRLSAGIEFTLREHMSESTLERLWGYSTRRYETVSVRTLNVLCRFIGFNSWEHFCDSLSSGLCESELFSGNTINTSELPVGARIRIGWPPDRLCIVRYLGDNRFIAEETENSTMQTGDTFSCLQFQKGRELHLDDFRKADPTERFRYVVGLNSGLTTLEIL
ncbi:MAG: hypothetical protein IIX08_02220 [Bacteroidales bacterium]|jgi:hypothetical protein|nr:hypothetical protein [Bacteroidales bacterium]